MGYKILLADDSVTVQKIITLTFSDEGVDVVTVNNGDEAISRLQYLRPALVMADVSIPGRNGYQICEFVKTHPEMKNTPVILLVPAFEPFDEERARQIGADYHLAKPFQSIRTLISTVKSLIERKADEQFSVTGSGLTAVRAADQINSEAAEVDPKRAKIDELIRLSSQATVENNAEDEVLFEVDLTQSSGRYSEALAAASASDGSGAPSPAVIESYHSRRTEAAAQYSVVPAEVLDFNMDNVLELEDVLPEITPMRGASELDNAKPAAYASAELVENPRGGIFPQSAIDEIVDRVSARLTEDLVGKLSGEIARRVAPEVAELVIRQLLAEPVAARDPENLLDID